MYMMFLLYFSYCGAYLRILNGILSTLIVRNKGFNDNDELIGALKLSESK